MANSERRCPLCDRALRRSTCPQCGLWWVESRGERFAAASETLKGSALKLVLRPHLSLVATLLFLGFAGLGFGALWAGLWSMARDPHSVLAGLAALVGFSLGGWSGLYGLGAALQPFLHALLPARLTGDSETLRVQVWHTWNGLWDGFRRRTNALIPREQITRVMLMTGQGGESQLFLEHSSGLAFGTGWSGNRQAASQLAQQLEAWIL